MGMVVSIEIFLIYLVTLLLPRTLTQIVPYGLAM